MKPLEGIKVLDFTQFFAGPIATLLMSDMGAEVIKLENPPLGDATRYGMAVVNSASSHYTTRNRGKKSVAMNLKDERQKIIFLEMVKTADVVIENFKPGTLQKYGITYEVLKAINPKIVFTSISGYGQYGPYRNNAAYDGAVQAEAGLISFNGDVNGRPVKTGVAIADATAGLVGCIGTLAALADAQRTGVGRWVDVSMMDSVVTIMENFVSSYCVTGVNPVPTGNRMVSACPFNDFPCKDGNSVYICISTDAQFEKFSHLVNHPEWLEDERFGSMSDRARNHEVLEPLVAEAMLQFTAEEMSNMLAENKLVFGRINTVADVVKHPQILARNMMVNAVYPDGTTFKVPGCPIKMTEQPEESEYYAAPMGHDTMSVLSRYADEATLHEIYDSVLAEIDELAAKKYKR